MKSIYSAIVFAFSAAFIGVPLSSMAQPRAASPLAAKDKKWAENAAHGGIAEVQAGQLASTQGKRADVRSFGQQMVNDHGKANDELKAIADRKGLALPSAPDDKHMKMLAALQNLSDDKFDKEYLKTAGVKEHKDAEKLFKDGARNLKDPELRAFAQRTLPTVQGHLKMVQEMNK